MNIIRPIAITDAMMASTNVPETDYDEFEMGKTYYAGNRVMDTTGAEILTLDVAPVDAWEAGDLVTGQSSGKTCRVISKLTSLTYRIRERTGAFTLGETIGVTGTPDKLADQGAAHPTITASTDKVHKIYESLPSGLELLTLDVAPATPWLPNWIITGQTSLQSCRVVKYLTSLTYLVKERTGAFALDETIGVTGTAVLLADQGAAHPVFSTPANVGHYPADDLLLDEPLWWEEVGANNRWAAYDDKIGGQTEQAESIEYTMEPGLNDSIALLNMDALSVSLVVMDPVEGEVYNETINLIDTAAVIDWYTYFFEPPNTLKTDIVRLAMPLYSAATLAITISYPGGTAKIGAIIIGRKSYLGVTLYSPEIGITDYSVKEADSYGRYSIDERAYSRRMTSDLRIQNTSIDEVHRLLSLYRATPLVWVSIDSYASMIVYGFYRDFSIVMSNLRHSDCAIEIEGLT